MGVPEIGSPLSQAETLVEVWFESADTQIKEIIIQDKYNLIDNEFLSVFTQKVQCSQNNALDCLEIIMNYRYLESPLYSTVVVSISDQSKNTITNYFNDGVQVEGESLNPPTMIKVPASLAGNHLYPQKRGLVELEQIDRKVQLWKDVFGYIWQEDGQKYHVMSDIKFKPKLQKDTLNDAIESEIKKAQKILNSYLRLDSIYMKK